MFWEYTVMYVFMFWPNTEVIWCQYRFPFHRTYHHEPPPSDKTGCFRWYLTMLMNFYCIIHTVQKQIPSSLQN